MASYQLRHAARCSPRLSSDAADTVLLIQTMLAGLITLLLAPIEIFLRQRRGKPEDINRFYSMAAWKRARYEVLTRNPACLICGASAKTGARMNVDHIKPLSKRWDLRLTMSNLQTLCASCNWGNPLRSPRDKGCIHATRNQGEKKMIIGTLSCCNPLRNALRC